MNVKNRHLVIFCVVFTIVQFWFGIGGMGMEFKGSPILMAPFSLYFLNWFLLMFAVFWARHARKFPGVLIFLIATSIHYVLTISYVVAEINRFRIAPTGEQGLGRVLTRYPEELVFGSLTYLLGNIFIWILFLKRDSQ